jgi:hypothetical protein
MNNLRGVAALLLQALLLRARRQRPNDRRAAQKHDKLAPPHELPSDEARTLAHKRACASRRNLSAYVGSGSMLLKKPPMGSA